MFFIVTNTAFAIFFIIMNSSNEVEDVIYEEVLYLFAMIIVAIPFLGLVMYQLRRLF